MATIITWANCIIIIISIIRIIIIIMSSGLCSLEYNAIQYVRTLPSSKFNSSSHAYIQMNEVYNARKCMHVDASVDLHTCPDTFIVHARRKLRDIHRPSNTVNVGYCTNYLISVKTYFRRPISYHRRVLTVLSMQHSRTWLGFPSKCCIESHYRCWKYSVKFKDEQWADIDII